MRINIELVRFLFVLTWRYLSIVWNDLRKGKNPIRIYLQSYSRYKQYGLTEMLKRLNREYFLLQSDDNAISYEQWCLKNEHIKNYCEETGPLVSIIVQLDNTGSTFFSKAIASVQKQTYQNWELWLVEKSNLTHEFYDLIDAIASKEKRIQYYFNKEDENRPTNLNNVLLLCRGEWIVFFNQNDLLRRDALCEIIHVINKHNDLGMIYSDEDKIDFMGERSDPHFKSDWNPDLLRSQNYIAHLCAMRRELVLSVGGIREEFDGSEDYDLILRVSGMLRDDEVFHISKVLYHWRKLPDSTALNENAKPYAWENGRLALQSYLDIVSPGATARYGIVRHTYRVDYPLVSQPKVSLIIPTRDGYSVLHRCIASILANTRYENYEIIIIDNQSRDYRTLSYMEKIAKLSHVRILQYDAPFNYSAINNMAVREAEGDIVGMLNDDIEIISEGWLQEMIKHAMRPEIGAVGAKLYYDNDTIQHAGVILGIGGVAGHSHKHFSKEKGGCFSRLQLVQNYSAITGACLIVHKALYESVGGFDEINLPVAFNDVDFCLKLQKQGYRNLWTPYVEAYHHESVSRGSEDTAEKLERFDMETRYMMKTWKKELSRDPYYSSNLNKENGDFSLGARL